MGEREIAALLRQIEEEDVDAFLEGGQVELIDAGFDDLSVSWETLGISDAHIRLRSSRLTLRDDDDTSW